MENIFNFMHVAGFSIAAYLLGTVSGKKTGFIRAIKSMPVTVLEISENLQLKENKKHE